MSTRRRPVRARQHPEVLWSVLPGLWEYPEVLRSVLPVLRGVPPGLWRVPVVAWLCLVRARPLPVAVSPPPVRAWQRPVGPWWCPARGRRHPPGAWWGRASGEEGSGTVLALGALGVLLVLALAVTGLATAQSASGRARAAADLAALGGASALTSVIAPADPCATASRVALANGATLSGCEVAGEDVTVTVTVEATILGVPRTATARARAGPVNPVG